MRQADIYIHNYLAGRLTEQPEGYFFAYYPAFLAADKAEAISNTFPLSDSSYTNPVLFPFFDFYKKKK